MMNKEDIAEFLLQRGYLLTALEFYQELLEDDGTELELLKNHFIKQQPNFESESPRHKADRRRASDVMAAESLFHSSHSSHSSHSHSHSHSHTYSHSHHQHQHQQHQQQQELAEKLKEKDDKVSLLEYELRRAREDITNLRTQLTNIVKKPSQPVSSPSSPSTPTLSTRSASHQSNDDELQRFTREHIREHELKVLNYLIKNYLVQNKYSLTAITFSEEMPEELTTWESVGLETPEPPPILSLYRYFFDNEDSGIQGALSKSITEATKLKKELAEKDAEYRSAKKIQLQYQKENEQLLYQIKELGATVEELKKNANASGTAPITEKDKKLDQRSSNTNQGTFSVNTTRTVTSVSAPSVSDATLCPMRSAYKSIIRKRRYNRFTLSSSREIDSPEVEEASARIAQEISRIGALESEQQAVCVIADCLPHIVPGVLLSKREELIPVILVAISQHPSNTERFALTKLLFNLIKKPNELQRKVIMNGCIALASIIGPQRTETELLTQCWEQIGDKHSERRILVADSCGQLAAYVLPELRLSLLLSILQQMIEDKNPMVRAAVARNLALLVACLDTEEKYVQIAELFVQLLGDNEDPVPGVTKSELLPAIVHLADIVDCFHSEFLNVILSEIQSSITGKNEAYDEEQIKELVDSLLSCLLLVVPRLREVVFASNPSISAKDASGYEIQSMATLVPSSSFSSAPRSRSNSLPTPKSAPPNPFDGNNNTFTTTPSSSSLAATQNPPTSRDDDPAPRLTLLSDKVVTKLKTAFDVYIGTQPEGDVNTKDWPALDWLINEFLPRLLQIIVEVPRAQHSWSATLVEIVASVCVLFGVPFTKKIVKHAFIAEMQSDTSGSVNNKKVLLLPVYLAGVLTCLDEAEITKYLHEISVEENNWSHNHLPVLKEVVGQLSMQTNFKTTIIVDTLCDMLAHPSNQVRLCVVTLFNVVIPSCKPAELTSKVQPALITLANDPDDKVRNECIEPLANVVVNSRNDDSLDKLTVAFDKLMESEDFHTRLAVVHALANIIPHLTFKRRFRDESQDILPLLVAHARKNSTNTIVDQRKKMANALFEAFRSFVSASLSKEIIEEQVLPGLRALMLESPGIRVDTSFKMMVQSVIQDMKNNNSTAEKQSSTNINLPKISEITTPPKATNPTQPSNNTPIVENNSTFGNNDSNTGSSTPNSNTNAADKGSTRKNIFGKLDAAAASITAASITNSLKDFDKAIPKWTWKNK